MFKIKTLNCNLDNLFQQLKIVGNLDYAIVNAAKYGDCSTCVNAALADQFGEDSKGIFCKLWTSGPNKDTATLDEKHGQLFVSHDISAEQYAKIVDYLTKQSYDWTITPVDYDPARCLEIRW